MSKTHQEFIKDLKNKNPNFDNIEIIGRYIKLNKKIKCRCKVDNYEWEIQPNYLLRGRGCPKCSSLKKSKRLRKTPKQFVLEVQELVGDEYTILGEYKTKKIKIKMRHNTCKYEWDVRPGDFLRGRRCPECTKKRSREARKLGNDEFLKRVNAKFGDEFEVGEYKNKRVKVHLKHKQCGYEWDALPSTIYRLKGCPRCLGNRHVKSTDDFKKMVFEAVGEEYTVLGEYNGATTTLLMRHNICNDEYYVAPSNFLRGTRCPKCAVSDRVKRLRKSGHDFGEKIRGKSKYVVNVGDIHGYWLVLEANVHSKDAKEKNRNSYNNALCLCTKCNKNTKVISYSRLIRSKDSRMCMECAGFIRKTTEQYIKELAEKNPLARLKEDQIYINSRTKLIHLCSLCNKEISITPDAALSRGQNLCRECAYIKGAALKTRTTDEYIQELVVVNPFVKLKEGESYITCDTKVKHICSRCKGDWNVAPITVLSGHIMCNNCCKKLCESTHATIIKQVYKHHYKDAIWEERIFVDDDNKYYEVDIVNHERKEAIEIDGTQHKKVSSWHKAQAKKTGTTPKDILKQQKIRDKKVNQYFKSIGYKLIRIDIHNISPLEALQQVFPEYDCIPEWIDFSGKITRDKWDVSKAQELLNQYVPMSKISRNLGISQSIITRALKCGKLVKPNGYRTLNERTWDLKEAQKLLNEYISYKEIRERLNITVGSFDHALNKGKLVLPNDYKEKVKNK